MQEAEQQQRHDQLVAEQRREVAVGELPGRRIVADGGEQADDDEVAERAEDDDGELDGRPQRLDEVPHGVVSRG